VFEGHEERVCSLLELGDVAGAKAALEDMKKVARELRQPSQEWLVTVHSALQALLEGRYAEAEALIPQARLVGQHAQSWNAEVSYGIQLYVLRRDQNRLDEVQDLVRRSAQEYASYPIWRCVRAQMAVELAALDEARHELALLGANGFRDVPFDEEWLVSMGLLAETVYALRDAEPAAVLYERLLGYGDRVAVSMPEISTGAVARYLGLLADTAGRPDDAERHFEEALAINRRIGARPWLARTQDDYAHMLLARRAHRDGEKADALLAEAAAIYEAIGMKPAARAALTTDT
jgi:tetratricopeptide (TPR) repeat protein